MSLMIPAWVNGVLTPVEKLEAHEKGLKHKAISVFMICNGKILIQRRALEKYHTPGLWANTCCTHPLWNEAPEDCAMRRMKEELAIENIQLIYRDRIEYRADVGNGLIEHEVVDLFITHVDAPPPMAANPDEVMDLRWVEYHDLLAEVQRWPSRFTPWLRIYLDQHSDRIFSPEPFVPFTISRSLKRVLAATIWNCSTN